MEANKQNPSQVNSFHVDRVHETSIAEWNKKRKPQTDQLDLLRPKHKCRVRNFSSETVSMFDENPDLEGMHTRMVMGKLDAAVHDDTSKPESAKDSNSFTEISDTAMSVYGEAKYEADCANTCLYGRPYNVEDNQCSLEESKIENTSSGEEDTYVERECNSLYHNADIKTLQDLEEHILTLGNHTDNLYSEYAEDSNEQSIDKEFEDILHANGVNPNMYVLSSGRWNVSQEAQSGIRPPTIDQEFEQYFSTLML